VLLGYGLLAAAQTPTVNEPYFQQVSLGTPGYVTMTGTNWDFSGLDTCFCLGGECGSPTACTQTGSGPSSYVAQCPLPTSTSATGDLDFWFYLDNSLMNPYIWYGLVQYVGPSITSVSPSTIGLGGGTVTLTGTFFGTSAAWYTYVSVQSGVAGSVTTCSSTQIVASLPSGGASPSGPLTLNLAWGSGPYTTLPSAVSFVYPAFASVTPTTWSHTTGGSITITGTEFGPNLGFYTWVSIGSLTVSTTITSCTGTTMVVPMPTCTGTGSAQTVYVHWGTGSYGYVTGNTITVV